MAESRHDGVPEGVPISRLPIDRSIIATAADDHGVDVARLVEALEAVHEHVAARARDLTVRYTDEFGAKAVIFRADVQQMLFVDPDEWAEIGGALGLDEAVRRAAERAHDREARRIEGHDGAHRAPSLETNAVLVMATPPVQDWLEAGLSLQQAFVQTLRVAGDSQDRIGEKLGIATGTVKSHCNRIDRKVREAQRLVGLVEDAGPARLG